jgi:hypothetical protein
VGQRVECSVGRETDDAADTRLPTNASWLDQIEVWFSLLQEKLLLPNHFENLKELEHAILDFITRYNQTARPLEWSYTARQLEHKLAPRLRREEKEVRV